MKIFNVVKKIEDYVNKFDQSSEGRMMLKSDFLEGDDYLDHLDRVLVWKSGQGDIKAKELFIAGKISYVQNIVKVDKSVNIYKNKGLDEDDLFQTGMLGVLEAIEKYDFRVGVKVRTFLAGRVRFAIKNSYRDYGMLNIPREANSIYTKFIKKFEDLPEKISENVLTSMSNEIGLDSKKIMDLLLAIKSNNYIFCYDNQGYVELDNKSREKSNYLVLMSFYEEMNKIFDYKVVLNSFSILSERERYIMEEVYIKDKTQKFVAEKLGCSSTTVSKLKKQAILKIQEYVKDYS